MATPALNVDTSVVDYLKSIGKASDYGSRSSLASTYGIANYSGSESDNISLLSKLKANSGAATPPGTATNDPTKVTDLTGANSYINNSQQQDFSSASKTGDPAVRTSTSNYQDLFDSITKSLTPTTAKPDVPKLADTYSALRTQYGVTDLESQLTDLQKQARDIQSLNQVQVNAETGKPVALNVIEGRVSEEAKQNNERLAAVNNSISTITSQLNTKYNVIDSVMKFTGQDYANAADAYDKEFAQNISAMNLVNDTIQSEKTDTEHTQDDARANLQIIYNNLNSGAADASSLTDAEKANITKLELTAGLPSGFYSSIQSKNPKSDILSTTTREVNGKKYADVILRNADGSLTTKTTYLGGVDQSGAGKPTEGDKKGEAYSSINSLLSNKDATTKAGKPVLSNGKLTPEGFKSLVDYGATQGINRGDIISQYSGYLATEGVDYGLTQKEKSDLGLY